MNTDYTVGDLIYDANIYDGMNTDLSDLQFYKRWLPQNKGARILELCCGTGRLTLPIARDGYNISGVDYTPSMLAQARLKASEVGLEINFIEADFLVDTFHSTDAGVAYLVTCGEGKIYHAGDLHDWVFDSASERENRQMTGMYRHEIDKMKNISLDVAFVPLDPRQERRYADGILYFLQKVKAKQVYPMHFWSHCSIIDKFLAEYPEYADVIKK
mgnify:CR=1 FL=1